MTFRNGWRSSLTLWWIEKFPPQEKRFARSSHEPLHPKPPPKVVSGKHSTSLETEIGKYAKGPK